MRLRDLIKIVRAAWPNESMDEFAERMRQATDGVVTRSGVAVGPTTAMTVSAFFCGVNLIMGAVASMKCILYRRTGESSRERFKAHPLYKVLHDRANPYMTAHQWKRSITGYLVLWGNTYSIMLRDPYRGTIIGVERILHPAQVKVFRDKKSGRPSYEVMHSPGNSETLFREGPRFIFHVPGPGFNGVTGYSLLTMSRESIGLTAAMEAYGQGYFAKGVHAGGFIERPLEAPKFQTDDARTRFMESIAASYSGLKNQGKYVLLEEGSKFHENVMPLEDAQFLSSRTFQIDEVARWLNLSPARLKELSRATFSNIEQLQIMDLQDCFLPWCSLIESEMNAQLIEPDLQDKAFAEFNMDSLLRADTVSRNNALAIQRQWGKINVDEWREMDNQNPISDGSGQKYLVPINYTTSDKVGQEPPAQQPPPGQFPPERRKPGALALVDAAAEKRDQQLLLGLDGMRTEMRVLAAQRQTITVNSAPVITVDGKHGKVRKTTTITKRDEAGQLAQTETIEEPADGE